MRTEELRTLQDLAVYAAQERPDKVWLREKAGKEIAEKTFGQFYEDARKVCSRLTAKGDGVVHAALLGTTSIAYITCLIGITIGGNVAVPIDAQLPAEEMADNLNRADVTVLFYDRRFRKQVEYVRGACPQITDYVCFTPEEGEYSLDELLEQSAPA